MHHNAQHVAIRAGQLALLGGILAIGSWAVVMGDAPTASTALPKAHAHNDYYHDRPLFDALSHGFCSVEADVFPVDGKLLVAHSKPELKPDRDLENLYLKPLAERVEKHGGSVHPDGPLFTLLVDFKSDAQLSYKLLNQLLKQYETMLDTLRDGKHHPGAVRVVISGDRPIETVKNSAIQRAMIDGRLTDLTDEEPNPSITMISDRWTSHFRWRGEGEIPSEELTKLRKIVKQTHEQGRVLRFLATPERIEMWQLLHRENVDLINTDYLPGLSAFLRKQSR